MTRTDALALILLLSAIESWALTQQRPMPDYLHEHLGAAMEKLEAIVLGGNDDH
ncbi:hypothetical protein [Thiohalocapsa marina]|uniref:hypothetical protein n=1 Tax=Thiohalocapsa marina TaxID=424902 RepID=UPI0036DE7790